MENIKLGVGIFIVREDAQEDLDQTLQKLAAIGYDGVELLGLFGRPAAEVRGILDRLSIRALGDHMDVFDFLKDPARAVSEHNTVGCTYLTLGAAKERAAEDFDGVAQAFETAARACLEGGLIPLYHNHDHDMRGEMHFTQRLLDAVPSLGFEPDLGWMFVAGQDPARFLRKYRDRVRVVHLKDVFVEEDGFTFRPTGYGNLNTAGLMPLALACEPDWLMVDHDLAYERDSYQDLALSYHYVKDLLRIMG